MELLKHPCHELVGEGDRVERLFHTCLTRHKLSGAFGLPQAAVNGQDVLFLTRQDSLSAQGLT